MFTILYVLVVLRGVYFFEPVAQFDDYRSCARIVSELGYVVPGVVLECVEYRDV